MPHPKHGRVSLAVFAAMLFAAACSAPDRRPPPGADAAARAQVAVAAPPPPPQRQEPAANPRLHTRQGGPLCDRTDARDPRPFRDSVPTFAKEDLSVRPTFLCRLRAERRPVRLTVMGEPGGWVDSVLVHSPASAREPRQVLRLDVGEPPPLGSDFLQGVDLNRDGWMDVKVSMFWGATGNRAVDVFMFDPARDRFVRDTVLSGESHVRPLDGEPCVRTGWVFGHAGMLHSYAEYCWLDGRWTIRWSESQVDTVIGARREHVYFRTTRHRRAGGTYTSRRDTVKMDPGY